MFTQIIKINNNISFSGNIDINTYNVFCQKLFQVCNKKDFSQLVKINTDKNIFEITSNYINANINDIVVWLRLIDIFILRPHRCYLTDQHISINYNYMDLPNDKICEVICDDIDVNIVVLTIINNMFCLKSKLYYFNVNPMITYTLKHDIPLSLWTSIIYKVIGQQNTDYPYWYKDTDTADHPHPDAITPSLLTNDRIKQYFTYKDNFDIDTLLNLKDINTISDIFNDIFDDTKLHAMDCVV